MHLEMLNTPTERLRGRLADCGHSQLTAHVIDSEGQLTCGGINARRRKWQDAKVRR